VQDFYGLTPAGREKREIANFSRKQPKTISRGCFFTNGNRFCFIAFGRVHDSSGDPNTKDPAKESSYTVRHGWLQDQAEFYKRFIRTNAGEYNSNGKTRSPPDPLSNLSICFHLFLSSPGFKAARFYQVNGNVYWGQMWIKGPKEMGCPSNKRILATTPHR
jgi:hypothetical protein